MAQVVDRCCHGDVSPARLLYFEKHLPLDHPCRSNHMVEVDMTRLASGLGRPGEHASVADAVAVGCEAENQTTSGYRRRPGRVYDRRVRAKQWETERGNLFNLLYPPTGPFGIRKWIYETARCTRPCSSNGWCRKKRPVFSSRRESIGHQAPTDHWSVARNHRARLFIWSNSVSPGLRLSGPDRREL